MKTNKFRNKYRIGSHRKPHWDYSSDAFYFLTIITQHRKCNLGEIKSETMIFSDFGKIVEIEWLKSFEIRNELLLHEFVIMPNPIHAIVEIKNEKNVIRGRSQINYYQLNVIPQFVYQNQFHHLLQGLNRP